MINTIIDILMLWYILYIVQHSQYIAWGDIFSRINSVAQFIIWSSFQSEWQSWSVLHSGTSIFETRRLIGVRRTTFRKYFSLCVITLILIFLGTISGLDKSIMIEQVVKNNEDTENDVYGPITDDYYILLVITLNTKFKTFDVLLFETLLNQRK